MSDDKPGLFTRLVRAGRRRPNPPLLPHPANRSVVGLDAAAMSSTIPFNFGDSTGWLDSNDQFTPEYLHGAEKTPGKLLEIRRTDDVISPAMDSRREMMASLTYEVRPRPRMLQNARAQQVAIAVGARLNSMPGQSLPWWVSSTYDHWSTSGFSLDEIILDRFNRLTLAHIRPGLVRWFEQDETGREFECVRVRARYTDKVIPERKLAYFARFAEPGEFRGQSAIRCMLATSETTLQLYSALLQSIRYSMGFPYLTEDTGAAGRPLTDADKTNAMKQMSNLLKGKSDIAFFAGKLKPEILASQTPAMQQFGPLAQFQAERKQAAAMNALSNLGMRGVGSRSLGEVVQDADMRALKGHLDLFMRNVSGDFQTCGTLMRTLTELEGEHPDLAPEIVIRWDDGKAEKKSREHLEMVAKMALEVPGFATPSTVDWLRDQAGVPSD